MSTDVARPSRARGTLPPWRNVLAVVAHPDDESFGLGAVVDAFTAAGARVGVLCLTEGESSTLGTGTNLAARRRAELEEASAVLKVSTTNVRHHPDGDLGSTHRHVLAGEVVDEVGATRAEGLLVFDVTGVTGHPDHVVATAAALLAADVLDVPVLAWTLPVEVADLLNEELGSAGGAGFRGRTAEEVDLVIEVDRRRQIEASRSHRTQAAPASPLWRRLELLGDREHLTWLRRPEQPDGSPVSPRRP